MFEKVTSNDKLISVVIPTYNRAHLLEKIIPTYMQERVLEIIMVDDGSSDDTGQVLSRIQGQVSMVKHLSMGENSGQCAALNRGIDYATGEFIYFGDDDSVLLDGSLPYLLDCLNRYNADIAGARAVYMNVGETMDESLARTRIGPGYIADMQRLKFAFNSDPGAEVEVPCVPACALMRTELAREIQFDPAFSGNGLRQETDFQFRASEAENASIWFCPKAVAVNLPREQATGGSWSMNWLKYEKYAAKNNWLFLDRHHDFLKQRWGVKRSKIRMQITFLLGERLDFALRRFVKTLIGDKYVEKIRRRRLRRVKY